MTLYTSDTDNTKLWLRRALVFTSVSLFLALFGAVNEMFSHGVYSYSMIYAFAYPLVLGAFPSIIMAMLSRPCKGSVAFDLYVFAIAFATVGSLIDGVLEIYGTSNRYMVIFNVVSVLLLAASVILWIVKRIRHRKTDGN